MEATNGTAAVRGLRADRSGMSGGHVGRLSTSGLPTEPQKRPRGAPNLGELPRITSPASGYPNFWITPLGLAEGQLALFLTVFLSPPHTGEAAEVAGVAEV